MVAHHCYRFFEECDGVVHCTNPFYEGIALRGFQEWLKQLPNFALSPLSPPASAEEIAKEKAKSHVGAEVEDFLDRAFDKYGPNSVVYISFGTVFWSSEPEKIWAVLDVLMEEGIPFVSLASSSLWGCNSFRDSCSAITLPSLLFPMNLRPR